MRTIKVIQLINATVYEHLIIDRDSFIWQTSEVNEEGLMTFTVVNEDDDTQVEINNVVAVIPSEFDGGQKEVQ